MTLLKVSSAKSTSDDTSSLYFSKKYNEIFNYKSVIKSTLKVPNAKMTSISGTFLSKVFEDPYKNMGKWIKQMDEYVSSKGEKHQKLYFYYATCPKCAKKTGKNYVVLLAKIR